MPEYEYFNGENFITFDLIEIDDEKREVTVAVLNNEESLTLIATEIIKLHSEKTESESMLKILSEQKNEAVKSLNNIMKALEAGIINDTTKNRMAELERTIKEFDNKILYEKAKIENCVTVDDIKKFVLTALKKTSYALIRNLIKQIVVYDDKIEIFYYYTSKNPDDNGRDFTLIEGSETTLWCTFGDSNPGPTD